MTVYSKNNDSRTRPEWLMSRADTTSCSTCKTTPRPIHSPTTELVEASPPSGGWTIFVDPFAWLMFALALGLDQFTKWLVTSNLALFESVPEEGFFRITYVWNTGTAFGLFTGRGDILTVVSLVAVAILIFFYRHAGRESLVVRLAIGLQLGGALGNIVDRFRLGHVTDFIDVGPWPIFNIADSSIVIGIGLMVFYLFVTRESRERHVESPAGQSSAQPLIGEIPPQPERTEDSAGSTAATAPTSDDRG